MSFRPKHTEYAKRRNPLHQSAHTLFLKLFLSLNCSFLCRQDTPHSARANCLQFPLTFFNTISTFFPNVISTEARFCARSGEIPCIRTITNSYSKMLSVLNRLPHPRAQTHSQPKQKRPCTRKVFCFFAMLFGHTERGFNLVADRNRLCRAYVAQREFYFLFRRFCACRHLAVIRQYNFRNRII